ncbi:MAG: hypothetical protein PHC28_01520 [Flavobacterium sp.]|uniref:hypothetical protein n=1 Tax=Flavobacterium sp. TaxID=239 RepID=UPI002610C344|nr:hypothetical protein [Flavobacterium sp.]MDD5149146.1 hypothetical protein [Flavobacterium sp.]
MQIGHRNSIDIELFGKQEIDPELFTNLLNNYGKTEVTKSSKNILITDVAGIKVDFVNYQYKILDKPLEIEGIRMLSKADVAAMKLNAIAGRGSKKDFTLKQMMGFYNEKYFDGSEFMVLKSLYYFEEADSQPQTKMFKDFNWESCKQKIIEEVLKLQ